MSSRITLLSLSIQPGAEIIVCWGKKRKKNRSDPLMRTLPWRDSSGPRWISNHTALGSAVPEEAVEIKGQRPEKHVADWTRTGQSQRSSGPASSPWRRQTRLWWTGASSWSHRRLMGTFHRQRRHWEQTERKPGPARKTCVFQRGQKDEHGHATIMEWVQESLPRRNMSIWVGSCNCTYWCLQ